MFGTIDAVIGGVLAFVGGHFLLSSWALRQPLVTRIGEEAFRGIYSLVMLAALVWTIIAYGAAPTLEVWTPMPWTRWVPNLLMPLACLFLVAGITTRSPTAVGGEVVLSDPNPLRGIVTVTRHPFLWGTGLWALAHLATKGDLASIFLFGSMAVLSFVGMVSIDGKQRRKLKEAGDEGAWGPVVLTTSVIPFQAALENRTRIDWAGIGWLRLLGGVVLWAVLYGAHPFFAGVWPHPM
ncbi:MAG: NnrU family protein [Alphaproteobacteria bacterium]|nr:NnrU family protein [Alphaproteobacteria bacterium]